MDRNESIERQCALKAAVDLTTSPNSNQKINMREVLVMAEVLADWIAKGTMSKQILESPPQAGDVAETTDTPVVNEQANEEEASKSSSSSSSKGGPGL